MKKTTEQPQQPKVETVVLPPNVVHVQQQTQTNLPPVQELAGAPNVAKQIVQANQEMNKRIEQNKL